MYTSGSQTLLTRGTKKSLRLVSQGCIWYKSWKLCLKKYVIVRFMITTNYVSLINPLRVQKSKKLEIIYFPFLLASQSKRLDWEANKKRKYIKFKYSRKFNYNRNNLCWVNFFCTFSISSRHIVWESLFYILNKITSKHSKL
jgi:hypothetical protein